MSGSPNKIVRASIGTHAVLGLTKARTSTTQRTAYLLLEGSCFGGCAFCPQGSSAPDRLSRISWPSVELERIIEGQDKFERVCIQSVLKPRFWEEVESIASHLHIPTSVSVNPLSSEILRRLKRVSDHIGIGLDAMNPKIFKQVRRPGSWDSYIAFIRRAIDVFGRGRAVVHLIAGLGETLDEAVALMRFFYSVGAKVSLFAFTPSPGTPMQHHPRPDVSYYRVLQLLRYMLEREEDIKRLPSADLDDYKEAFLTSGCPACDRPFYNESPRGPIYNFPNWDLLNRHWENVRREVRLGLRSHGLLPKEEVR